MEPELNQHFEKIHQQLEDLYHKQEGFGRAFFRGVMSGLGSVFGVALAIAVIGWFLNTIGVIPAFREQASSWRQTLEDIKKVR